jgi:hypothetical protein
MGSVQKSESNNKWAKLLNQGFKNAIVDHIYRTKRIVTQDKQEQFWFFMQSITKTEL